MWYVLGEPSNTSLNADRANSCTVPALLHTYLKYCHFFDTCAFKRGVATAGTYYHVYVEHTSIRARAANNQ